MTQLSFSRFSLTLLVAIAIAIQSAAFWFGYYHIKNLEHDWSEFAEHEVKIGTHIRNISEAFGYGGYIHHFKNIVLRGEAERFLLMDDAGTRLQRSLDSLKNSWQDDEVKEAIDAIQAVFNNYKEKEALLYRRNLLTPQELDRLVKVDDSPAIQAFAILRKHFDASVVQQKAKLKEDISNSLFSIAIWFASNILYLFIAYIGFRLIRQNERETLKLTALSQRLNVIINQSPNAILVANKTGTIINASEKTYKMFKTSRDQFIGTKVEQWMPKKYREQHVKKRDLFMQNHGIRGMDERDDLLALNALGKEFPVKINMTSIDNDYESIVVASIRDLSKNKKREQQKIQHQRLEAVGRLTAGVAHDFNNMLAIIVGNAEVAALSVDNDDEDLNESLAIIRQAADNAAELTSKLLAFSREQPVHSSRVDICLALQDLQSLLNRVMGEDITINVNIAEDLWPCFLDKVQLESALMNIAINAKNAMPRGGHFDISASNWLIAETQQLSQAGLSLKAGEYVIIRLMDTGSGIPELVLNKIFEPFFTMDNNKGSGLGLSMVYGFIKQSGGFIEVDSEENKGTTFTLYLPRYCESEPAPNKVRAAPVKYDKLKNLRILVIEDEAPVRAIATKLLELAHCIVFAAENREQAIAIAQQETLDVIFSDVVLQYGDNGFSICADIKQLQPQVQLVFASGYFSDDLKARQYLVEDVEILTKPYTREQVYGAILATM